MKWILAIATALALCSCATMDYAALESRVSALEKKKGHDYMTLAAQTGARRFWWVNSLTGASDSMSTINCGTGGDLTDGDMAFVAAVTGGTTGNFYVYHYDSSGTHSTDNPTRITCDGPPFDDTDTGDSDGGAWYLCNVYVAGIISTEADGYRYFEAGNTDHMDASIRTEGRCAYNKTDHTLECVDGDGNLQVIDMTND